MKEMMKIPFVKVIRNTNAAIDPRLAFTFSRLVVSQSCKLPYFHPLLLLSTPFRDPPFPSLHFSMNAIASALSRTNVKLLKCIFLSVRSLFAAHPFSPIFICFDKKLLFSPISTIEIAVLRLFTGES